MLTTNVSAASQTSRGSGGFARLRYMEYGQPTSNGAGGAPATGKLWDEPGGTTPYRTGGYSVFRAFVQFPLSSQVTGGSAYTVQIVAPVYAEKMSSPLT